MFRNINFRKQLLPHILVVAGFFIIVCIYFAPMVFQKKSIRQTDIMQFNGMSKEITENRIKYNEEPFWTNSMFSGMPSTMISMDHYGNLVKPLNNFIFRFPGYPASLIFISLVCFYILMMAFDVNILLAAIGAFAFAFASFNIISIEVGHNAKVACMAYMPLVFAGIVFCYRKNILLGSSLFMLGLALQIINNHVQITYYLAFICLIYIITEAYNAFKAKLLPAFFKASLALFAAAIIALGTNAGHFMAISEYSKYSIRGKTELKPLEENKEAVREDGLDRDYVFEYSNSFNEPFTFIIPNYMGGASVGSLPTSSETAKALAAHSVDPENVRQFISQVQLYFGKQNFVAGPFYIGAIVCFLFLLGLLIVKDNIRWALLFASIVGVLLMYGKNLPALNFFLFDHMPMYNKFRSVTMAVIIPQLCMSILAILAVNNVLNEKNKASLLKPLYIAAGITGGFALLVYIFAGTGNYETANDQGYQQYRWLLDAIMVDRKGMRTADALRSAILIALAFATIYFYIKNKIKENVALIALTVLTVFDFWFVDKRYLNDDNFEKKVHETYFTPTEADQFVLQDPNLNYRVFNIAESPFTNARTSYFHKSIGGQSPAKLRRYQDLIERGLAHEQQTFIEGLQRKELAFNKTPLLNMLNAKYILTSHEANGIILNDSALGNAWFVKEIKKVTNPDEEIAALQNFNPKTTAVIDVSRFPQATTTYTVDTADHIRLIKYKPYDLSYESNSSSDGFAVFSEIYYPLGWKAFIDGKETPVKSVNYVLRALEIPKGKHTIDFKMENETYKKGNTIGLVCSILLFVGLAGAIYFENKKQIA